MEGDRAEGTGVDTGEAGLTPFEIDRNSAGLFVSFKGIILTGLDTFTLFALTAHHNLRSLFPEGGENPDSRPVEAVTFLLD